MKYRYKVMVQPDPKDTAVAEYSGTSHESYKAARDELRTAKRDRAHYSAYIDMIA